VIGDESEGDDCDEVICTGRGEPGGAKIQSTLTELMVRQLITRS